MDPWTGILALALLLAVSIGVPLGIYHAHRLLQQMHRVLERMGSGRSDGGDLGEYEERLEQLERRLSALELYEQDRQRLPGEKYERE